MENDDNVMEFLLLHWAILSKWHDFIYKVERNVILLILFTQVYLLTNSLQLCSLEILCIH